MAHQEGQILQKHCVEAVRWFRLAAQARTSPHAAVAQRQLGWCYEQGLGVIKDPVEAVLWYQMAADAGDVQACFLLGISYARGQGVPYNTKDALRWLTLASEAGHAGAQQLLPNLQVLQRQRAP